MFGNGHIVVQGISSEIHGVIAKDDSVQIDEGKQVDVEVFEQKEFFLRLGGNQSLLQFLEHIQGRDFARNQSLTNDYGLLDFPRGFEGNLLEVQIQFGNGFSEFHRADPDFVLLGGLRFKKVLNGLLGIGLSERELVECVLLDVESEFQVVLKSRDLLQISHSDGPLNGVFLLPLFVVVFLAAEVNFKRVSLIQALLRTEVFDVERDSLSLVVEGPELEAEPRASSRGVGVWGKQELELARLALEGLPKGALE